MQIKCEGPGPHNPVDGILGESDRPVRGMRCMSDACQVSDDPTANNAITLQDRARLAMISNRDFLALSSPTNAQNAAQVKALTRQNNGIIRLLIGALDATD